MWRRVRFSTSSTVIPGGDAKRRRPGTQGLRATVSVTPGFRLTRFARVQNDSERGVRAEACPHCVRRLEATSIARSLRLSIWSPGPNRAIRRRSSPRPPPGTRAKGHASRPCLSALARFAVSGAMMNVIAVYVPATSAQPACVFRVGLRSRGTHTSGGPHGQARDQLQRTSSAA